MNQRAININHQNERMTGNPARDLQRLNYFVTHQNFASGFPQQTIVLKLEKD